MSDILDNKNKICEKYQRRKRHMNNKIFTAIIHKEDDLYVAVCAEIGTASQGNSIEEAISNLKEATELYLEEFPLQK